jgi:hypothetical protein
VGILSTVFTDAANLINAGSYSKGTTEWETALGLANKQLYQKFRGNMAQYQKNSPKAVLNFGETTITLDSLQELFRIIPLAGADPLEIQLLTKVVDLVQNIDVQYVAGGDFYSCKILPSNQFQTLAQNKVVPPDQKHPYARFLDLNGQFQLHRFQILPLGYINAEVSVILLPQPPIFTLTDSGGPIPTITVIQDFIWTEEKIPALVMLTIQNLGFTLQNGVLIQGAASLNAQSL